MTAEATRQRRRYSPEKRRALLLDSAASIVARDGVAQISMESVGREAGVSKSLVYNYFNNITELLQELLERELRSLRWRQTQAAEAAQSFEELVRNVTHEYLCYIEQRGLIIERLQSEPSISDMHNPTDFSREAAVDYLASIVVAHFNIPPELARAITDISFGLPASAGEYLLRTQMDLRELEDLTVSMIIGSITAARNDYFARTRPLRAPLMRPTSDDIGDDTDDA